jgi:hypothetical protein
MTFYTRTVKLRMTPEEAKRYLPTKGINVRWHKWNKDKTEAIAEVTASDTQPYPNEAHDKTLIDYEIDTRLSSRLLKGNIPNPKNEKTPFTLKTLSDNPLLKSLPKSKRDNFLSLEQTEIQKKSLLQTNQHLRELGKLNKNLRYLADKKLKPVKEKGSHNVIVEMATLESR